MPHVPVPSGGPDDSESQRSERRIIGIIGAVQFINILDFMMVMPLGPDFAQSLGIPTSDLGFIGGSYTAAAAVSGAAGAFFLDRFERKKALLLAMVGLSLGTLAGAFAFDFHSLLAARVLAGLFGGPATSIAMAIVTDLIPAERRGKAIGSVMSAFSVASVLGVPVGLQLATIAGWRAPFFAVCALGLLIAGLVLVFLPVVRRQPTATSSRPRVQTLFQDRDVLLAYAITALTMAAGFALIPNISAHLQQNLGYPREGLGVLYMAGGLTSFFTVRYTGKLTDRIGSSRVSAASTVAFVVVLFMAFVMAAPPIPVIVLFALFMVTQSARNVANGTLFSKVPRPADRAGFMSVQSAVQHLASAVGAMMSSQLLTTTADGRLGGVPRLALMVIAAVLLAVPLVALLEGRLLRRRADPPVVAASATPGGLSAVPALKDDDGDAPARTAG